MFYLLDTNICIYIIKKRPEIVLQKFLSFPLGAIGISTITLAELQFGTVKSKFPEKNKAALDQFLVPLQIFDFDLSASLEYGRVRAELERKGMPIGPLDMLIAAHAKSLNAVLVTNNEGEFNRVDGLQIENWTKP